MYMYMHKLKTAIATRGKMLLCKLHTEHSPTTSDTNCGWAFPDLDSSKSSWSVKKEGDMKNWTSLGTTNLDCDELQFMPIILCDSQIRIPGYKYSKLVG